MTDSEQSSLVQYAPFKKSLGLKTTYLRALSTVACVNLFAFSHVNSLALSNQRPFIEALHDKHIFFKSVLVLVVGPFCVVMAGSKQLY